MLACVTQQVQWIARTTKTNDKCRQIIMAHFGARNLHRKLLASPYFASKCLLYCTLSKMWLFQN